MRTRPDHREAVTRRLELLRAELDADADAGRSSDEEPWWETAPVLELASSVTQEPEAPMVPVPGRHAARRRVSPLTWLGDGRARAVPETLRGSLALGPWHLAVLALLVAAGLGVTAWWVIRGDPAVAPVASGAAAPLVPVNASGSGHPSAAATPTSAASTVTVDVAGKVRHPGVVALPVGSRVVDAIKAAGGAKPGAPLGGLNRARVLVDGEQIVVGASAVRAAVTAAPGTPADSASGAAGALVNLNTATVDELEALPEVGPVTAQAILDYRSQHGGFGSVDELLDIEGIGEKTLAKIAPHVTV